MISNNFKPKLSHKFRCENCDYSTSKKSNITNHYASAKHKKSIIGNEFQAFLSSDFCCNVCNKIYKDASGLWRHNKKCQGLKKEEETKENKENKENKETKENKENKETKEINENNLEGLADKELIRMIIKENSEFKNMMFEIMKNVQPNNITNNTNNSHITTNNNNHFNLQFFLNDTCKDAINLVDFVESLQVQFKDLEETARLGYSEGVSRIFINGLNKLDVTMRPIHCSDAKRETLYIKNQNEWTKEEPDKLHLSKAIKSVSSKNIQQIFEWQKKYPEYKDPSSRDSDRYMKMIFNTMSGSSSEEQSKNLDKIIKNITKQVVIDKNTEIH